MGRALAASTTVSRLYDGSFSHGYRNSLPDEAFHGTCALYAASPAGLAQARTLAAALTQGDAPAPVIFAACPADDQQPAPQPVADMATALADALPRFDAHIILGTPRQALPLLPAATGDAAVICCAESGRHAICLLDGPDHAGDRLTRRVARITGGLAITGPTEAEKENDTPAAVFPEAATASAVPSSPHGEVLVVGLGSGDPPSSRPKWMPALRPLRYCGRVQQICGFHPRPHPRQAPHRDRHEGRGGTLPRRPGRCRCRGHGLHGLLR